MKFQDLIGLDQNNDQNQGYNSIIYVKIINPKMIVSLVIHYI